jgi:hypothetical protein
MQIITEKNNQRVAESFNAVISSLNHIADDIKQSCADAVMDDDYDKVDASRASTMAIKNFVQELTELATRWNQGIFNAPVPEKPQLMTNFRHGVRTKSSPTRLRVIFPTINKQIQSRTAAQTFVESLHILKFEQVATLNKQVAGYPLVSKNEFSPDPNRYLKCGDWYVNFPSSTQYKKSFLQEISTALKIPLRVDVV